MAKRKIGQKFAGTYRPADTINLEKYPAWTKPLKEMFTQMMFNGFIRNTFYVDEREIIQYATALTKKYVKENPYDAMEIASKGRNEGFMRTLPILALSYASKEKGTAFEGFFLHIIKTPRDLEQFIDLTRNHRGLGRKIKTAINGYIHENLTPFYAYRYRNQLQTAIKLAHPKVEDYLKDYLVKYILEKAELNTELMPKEIITIETLKHIVNEVRLKNEPLDFIEEEICQLITKGKLHPDIVKGILQPTPAIWEVLFDQSPMMYLIKNLNAYTQHIGADFVLNKIESGHISMEKLKKGRVLPFRILQAWQMIGRKESSSYRRWTMDEYHPTFDTSVDRLRKRLAEISEQYAKAYDFSNLGAVAVCPDVSGSMYNNIAKYDENKQRKGSDNIHYAEIASLFAGVFCIGIKNSILIPWNDDAKLDYPKKIPDWRTIQNIWTICNGMYLGGTNMGAPIEALSYHNLRADTVICITDTEEWHGTGFTRAWINYRNHNPKSRAVLIRIDPYPTNPFPFDEAERLNIYQVYGVSDTVFKMLEALNRNGKASGKES